MFKPVSIIIDVEPDPFFVDPNRPDYWLGFEKAYPFFQEFRQGLEKSSGNDANFTWNIRLDSQIAETYSDPGWPIQQYYTELKSLKDAGDQIGIHVHAYRRTDSESYWVEDYGNQEWVNHCIDMAFSTYLQQFNSQPILFSMGGDWINHDTIMYAESKGIEVDLTLISSASATYRSKFKFRNKNRNFGTYTGTLPDLSAVQQIIYRPSSMDFRVPDPNRDKGIWIFPQSSKGYSSAAPKLKKLLSRRYRRVSRLNGASPKLFIDCQTDELRWQLKKLGGSDDHRYLTLIMATRKFNWPLAYSQIRKNSRLLLDYASKNSIRFVTPPQIIQQLTEYSD